jgi:hypothetical protein
MTVEDARYVDPMADARGHEAIDQTIAAVQAQFPDFVFKLTGPVDAHHNQLALAGSAGPSAARRPSSGSMSPSRTVTGGSKPSSASWTSSPRADHHTRRGGRRGSVAKATGLARPTVSTTLSKLAKTGEVAKADRAYRLPSTNGGIANAGEPAGPPTTADA